MLSDEYGGEGGDNVTFRTTLSNTALGILALAAAGSGLISAQALNVKPGQWETTTTTSMPGGAGAAPALPPGALDRLPPEQRARIEAQLKATSQPRTSVSTRCVTGDDVAKGFHPANVPQTCTYNLTVSNASQQKMTVTCDTDKAKSTGTVQIDAVDSENIKGSVQMATAVNGQTMNTNVTFTSKWVGPACSETKSGK
jgi:hypothetical protein